MFRHTRHKYKVAHARDRIRFTPQEVHELKKKVRGHLETNTILNVDHLKVLQEQNETEVRQLEEDVTNPEMDRSLAVPVYNKVTGERMLIVPKQPHPIYYQEHTASGLTIKLCRRMCLIFSFLLLFLNLYFLNMWVYYDHYYPLEFLRMQFADKRSRIHQRVLEYQMNIIISTISFFYSMWGISISTVFKKPTIVAAFFTWSIPFILPLILFAMIQIYNLASLDASQLKTYLFHTLWKHAYDKVGMSKEERYAWNQAQYSLKCCGINNYKDWYVADWGYWINRKDKPDEAEKQRRFPESCCPNYTMHHDDGYILRTRNYAMRMLFCQFNPTGERISEGCFIKLLLFFQSITQQLIWFALLKIGLIALAATFAFMAHTRYKRHTKTDHNYRYTCRDWIVDLLCIRCWTSVKDARKKRVGPAPLHLAYQNRPMDEATLERRRPHLIDKMPHKILQLEQNEEELSLDEEARLDVAGLIMDPIVEIIDEHNPVQHQQEVPEKKLKNWGRTLRKLTLPVSRADIKNTTGNRKGSDETSDRPNRRSVRENSVETTGGSTENEFKE